MATHWFWNIGWAFGVGCVVGCGPKTDPLDTDSPWPADDSTDGGESAGTAFPVETATEDDSGGGPGGSFGDDRTVDIVVTEDGISVVDGPVSLALCEPIEVSVSVDEAAWGVRATYSGASCSDATEYILSWSADLTLAAGDWTLSVEGWDEPFVVP